MRPFLVGIAGGTASGKTTLTQQLIEYGGRDKVVALELDRYYRPQDNISLLERESTNYDHPDALEFELIIDHLEQLRSCKAIEAPIYDFATHTRIANQTTKIEPHPIIIVEGILVFAAPKLRSIFDKKIFVDAPEDLRLQRRAERDVRERGRTTESVYKNWHALVQPMHLAHCENGRDYADLVIDGGKFDMTIIAEIWEMLWSNYSTAKLP